MPHRKNRTAPKSPDLLTPGGSRSGTQKRKRSVSQTDNAFSSILDASRRGVSTDAISSTFGDAFGRTAKKPRFSTPRAPIDRSKVILPVNPGRVNPGGGLRDLGASGAGGTGGQSFRGNNDPVAQPSINDIRRARGAAAKARAEAQTNANRARAEGRGTPSSVQRPGIQRRRPTRFGGGGTGGGNGSGQTKAPTRSRSQQRSDSRAVSRQDKAREKRRRQAFVKAGGQQAVDRKFREAGGTKTFNARTGKRSVGITNPNTGERTEFGSIQFQTRSRGRSRGSSSRSSSRATSPRSSGRAVMSRHARQLANRRRSEAARR